MKTSTKEQYKTDSCGGMKHCKNRCCNPSDKDCRECIEDSSTAIEEALNERR